MGTNLPPGVKRSPTGVSWEPGKQHRQEFCCYSVGRAWPEETRSGWEGNGGHWGSLLLPAGTCLPARPSQKGKNLWRLCFCYSVSFLLFALVNFNSSDLKWAARQALGTALDLTASPVHLTASPPKSNRQSSSCSLESPSIH